MSKSNLPPLDTSEDVKKYEAHSESKEIKFQKCTHKQVKYVNESLQCPCGAGWTGSRLDELYKVLTS